MSCERDTRLLQSSDVPGSIASLSRATIDRASTLFTVDVLSNDLLNDTIFSCCSPKTLLHLSLVCRAALVAVRTYFHHAFDINRHLSRFFDDPISFRTLQARTATLISGSQALQFLDRSYYPGSDLDLYAHMQWRHEVGRWLLAAGYTFVPSALQHPDFETAVTKTTMHIDSDYLDIHGMSEVFTFLRSVDGSGHERKVQLMVAAESPIGLVLRFHSTCVMNVITYIKAIALYPNATFEQRQTYKVYHSPGSSQINAVRKYRSRGWQVHDTIPWDVQPRSELAEQRRWLEDGHSWIIPLDMTDLPSPPANSTTFPDDPCVFTSWLLNFSRWGPSINWGQSVVFYHLKDTALRADVRDKLFYDYVVPGDADHTLVHVIQDKLDGVSMQVPGPQYLDASLLRLDIAALMREREQRRCQADDY